MTGEITELQVNITQDGEQGGIGLEQVAHFIRAFFVPALVALANADRHAVATLLEVVIEHLALRARPAHGRRHPRRHGGRTLRHRHPGLTHHPHGHGWRRGSLWCALWHRHGTLVLGVDPERLIEHHGLRAVFAVENPRHATGTVINMRNQVQHDLGFVGHADFRQIVEEMARPGHVLVLQGQYGATALGVGRLLPQRTLVGPRAFVNKLTRLLQQQHGRAKTRRIHLGALRRRGRSAIQADIAVAQVGEVADVGQLPLFFVALFLPFHHGVGCLGFKGRHFHGAAGAVVQQPDGILVGFNHADPTAFLLKRN